MAESRMVTAVDGPLAGQWWTWTDWMVRVDGARYMWSRHGRKVNTHLYRPAGYEVDHPSTPGATGIAVTVAHGPWQ
jgi:hypothetical protein